MWSKANIVEHDTKIPNFLLVLKKRSKTKLISRFAIINSISREHKEIITEIQLFYKRLYKKEK